MNNVVLGHGSEQSWNEPGAKSAVSDVVVKNTNTDGYGYVVENNVVEKNIEDTAQGGAVRGEVLEREMESLLDEVSQAEKSLGNVAIFSSDVMTETGNAGMGVMSEDSGEAEVKRLVAAENGYASGEGLTVGENVVGGESKLNVKDRESDDAADAAMELDKGWQGDLLRRNQEGLTSAAVKAVDRTISTVEKPAALQSAWFMGMTAMLRSFGRKLGDRG